MEIKIIGNIINEEKDFHTQLAVALGVQQYYGYNLHALWDLLGFGIERPIHLVWKDSSESKKKLGKQFEEIVSILERVRLEDEKNGWEDKFTYSLE